MSYHNRILHFHWTQIKIWHLGRKELALSEVCSPFSFSPYNTQ